MKKSWDNFFKYAEIGREFIKTIFKVFAPKWFTFLGWLLLIGTFSYFYKITGSKDILIILIISYVSMYCFLTYFLDRIKLTKLTPQEPGIKKTTILLILSILDLTIPIIIIYFSAQLIINVINQIAVNFNK